MKILLYAILLICSIIGFFSCIDNSSLVVDDDKMVDLLVDLHKYEAILAMRTGEFNSDSVKKVYRQTILKKHGVSQEQFDSSLAWYGRHIDDYVKIYDRVLQEYDRQILATNDRAAETGEIYEGIANDAENMWTLAPLYIISSKDENKNIIFEITDSNLFNNGDRLRWQLRVTNVTQEVSMMLGVDYDNNSTSFMSKDIRKDGKYNITLQTDSSLKVERLFGIVRCNPKQKEVLFFDSIVVDRLPLVASSYNIKYAQRVFKMPTPKRNQQLNDSAGKLDRVFVRTKNEIYDDESN